MIVWKKYRLKDICSYIGSGTTPKSSNSKYYDNGIYNWVNTGDLNNGIVSNSKQQITDSALKDFPTLRFYPKGTIIEAMYGATIGKVGMLDMNATVNQACCAMIVDRNKAIPNFVLYYLLYYKPQLLKESFGGTQPNVNQFKVSNIAISIPSREEQQRIVTYLDTKLSEIDHQVSLLTSKRDAYLRLKKSIINHAVTRGLDPNVKMKDSGIEWIGEVPEHWEVKRMKDIVKLMKGRTPEDLTFEEISYPYLTMDYLRNRSGKEILYPQKTAGLLKIDVGEIIVLWDGANAGEFILSKEGYLGSTMAVFLCDCKIVDKNYLYYLLKSVEKHSKYFANGTTIPHFDSLTIMNHQYALPPLPEQRAIATYLDDKCAKIDTIVSNLDKQISRYGDLKRSLIDEVITGKRAV